MNSGHDRLNRHGHYLCILLTIAGWLSGTNPALSMELFKVVLLESGPDRFVIEITTDESILEVYGSEQTLNSETVDLKFITTAGEPRLPIKAFILSVPPYARYRVAVVERDIELQAAHVSPNPRPERLNDDKLTIEYADGEDSRIYNSNANYPPTEVELNYLGFMRERYLLQVRFYPLRYNPVRNLLTLNKRIRFHLVNVGAKFPESTAPRTELSSKTLPAPTHGISNHIPLFDEVLSSQVLHRHSRINKDAKALSLKAIEDTKNSFSALEFYSRYSGKTRYKIIVEKTGIYALTSDVLGETGLALSQLNPQHFRLYWKGKEIPLLVTGEQDGTLDVTASLIFYGIADPNPFSKENVYWLIIDSNSAGVRMSKIISAEPEEKTPAEVFEAQQRFEMDRVYKPDMRYRIWNDDHWTWETIAPGSEQAFRIRLPTGLRPDKDAFVTFLSYCESESGYGVELALNRHHLGETSRRAPGDMEGRFRISPNIMSPGENAISVNYARGDQDLHIDWFEFSFSHNLVAEDDRASFRPAASGPYQISIDNFRETSIFLFQIVDSLAKAFARPVEVHRSGPTYSAKFVAEFDSSHQYLCLSNERFLQPKVMLPEEASFLHAHQTQTDYVMICYDGFIDEAQRLADFHSETGLTVALVKLGDIYDEFNYGLNSPVAIKRFLQYTYYYWPPPGPTYVLLIGDATYDYKDNLGLGNHNYVPTHLFENSFLRWQSGNDNWFVSLSGNDIMPDMVIGRLPVRNRDELKNIIDKIVVYGKNFTNAAWKKNVILTTDNSLRGEEFSGKSETLVDFIPQDYEIKRAYLPNSSGSGVQTRNQIVEMINTGALITNYYGHGATDLWAREKIFTNDDVEFLNNRNKYPFFTMITCLNGSFQDAVQECIAEKLLKARDRGAIAAWTPSGWIYISNYQAIGSALYHSIYDFKGLEIGKIVTRAKLDYLTQGGLWDHFEMFTLFGDPALKLGVIHPDAPIVNLYYQGTSLDKHEQYVEARPRILVEITGHNPISQQQLEIILDEQHLNAGDAQIEHSQFSAHSASIVLALDFVDGTHSLCVLVTDSTGLKGEKRALFSIQKDEFRFENVLNYPNPMSRHTYFTYELSQPAEVTIKIYTIAGRLIHTIQDFSMQPFNAIEWDGRDAVGDRVANGVYFYKIIATNGDAVVEHVEKIAKIE